MGEVKITGNTTSAVQSINDIQKSVEDLNNTTNKIQKTDEEKWQEERARALRKKEWLKSIESSEKEVGTTTSKVSEIAKKSWTEINSKYQFFKTGLADGIGLLTKFKDEIMRLEGVATQKTALKLLSAEGEDLNSVLERTVEITRGVATGNDILASVNQLMVKDFKLTAESLEKLIDVSATYSSITGESMNSVMEKLATSSQKESEKTLEKLGVYVDIEDELKKYAKTLNKTVENLSEVEKQNQIVIISTTAMKTKFDELGLTAISLESPLTHTFKRAEESINQVKNATINYLGGLYVESIATFEKIFEYYDEFQERFQAFIQDGFDGRDRVAKKWADKRYAEQQVELVKEAVALEKAETMKLESFKLYSDQQRAYGITNNELIYANYIKLFKDLREKAGSGTFIYSNKLFDIDSTKDVRNLASQMIFSQSEVDESFKKVDETAKKFNDKLKTILESNKKMKEDIEFENMSDDVARDEAKYLKALEDYNNFATLKVKHTKMYNAQLEELSLKFEIASIKYNKSLAQMGKTEDEKALQQKKDFIKDEQDLILKKMEWEWDLDEQNKSHKKKIAEEDKKRDEKVKKDSWVSEYNFEEDMKSLKREGLQEFADFSAMIITDVLMGEKKFTKEMIGDFSKMMGTKLITSGAFNFFEGTIASVMGLPHGGTQLTVGLAEIGAGIGLGGVAKITGITGGGSKSKDTTAKDSNTINQNMKTTQKVSTFLFPSERDYLQSLQHSNAKLNK